MRELIPGREVVIRLGAALLGERTLDLALRLELLRLEGREMFGLVEGLLDRDGAVTLVGVLLAAGGRWTLGAAEDFAACRLF